VLTFVSLCDWRGVEVHSFRLGNDVSCGYLFSVYYIESSYRSIKTRLDDEMSAFNAFLTVMAVYVIFVTQVPV